MQVIINGNNYILDENINVVQMITMYGITDYKNVVVELNDEIIKENMWQTTIVEDGDVVEIVSFVGGG